MSGTVRRVIIALAAALGLGLLGFLAAPSASAQEAAAGGAADTASSSTPKASADTPKAEALAPTLAPKPKPKPEPKADPEPAAAADTAAAEAVAADDPAPAKAEAVEDPSQVATSSPTPEQAALLPPSVHDHATTVVSGDETNALAVSVDDHPKAVTPGGHIDYDITITNVGSDPATGVVWADLIPDELTDFWVEFVDGSNTVATDWDCQTAGDPQPAVLCEMDPALALESGDYASFRVHATVKPDTPVGTVIQNIVLANWNENPGEFAIPIVAVTETPVVAKARNASFVVIERGLPLTGAAGLVTLLFTGLGLLGTGGLALGTTRRRRSA